MSKTEDLERLHALFKQDALTKAEFEAAKMKLLGNAPPSTAVVWGVCARLGQITPLASGTWRLLFLLPMALGYLAGAFFPQPLGSSFTGALIGGPIGLYVLLSIAGVQAPAAEKDKSAGTDPR